MWAYIGTFAAGMVAGVLALLAFMRWGWRS